MAFLGCKSLNFWIKHLKFCMQIPKCKKKFTCKISCQETVSVTFLPKNRKNSPKKSIFSEKERITKRDKNLNSIPPWTFLQQRIELRRKKIVTLKPTGDSTLTACFFQAVAGMFLSMSVSTRMQPTPVQWILLGFVCRC